MHATCLPVSVELGGADSEETTFCAMLMSEQALASFHLEREGSGEEGGFRKSEAGRDGGRGRGGDRSEGEYDDVKHSRTRVTVPTYLAFSLHASARS